MNAMEYVKVYQQELDKAMIADLCTGWMDANGGRVKYSGGAEVKIPKISMCGLGDYNRVSGYPEGDITLAYETMRMTQDRGRSFSIDAMDVDESGLILTAAEVMGEFQRRYVAPEVDAYRISRLSALAGDRSRAYAPSAGTILKELQSDISAIQDKIGDNEKLVVMMAIPVHAILAQSEDIAKRLDVTSFTQGGVETRVRSLDGIPILRVPSARMKSAYVFYDGVTASDGAAENPTPDQRAGGFEPAGGAVMINWIVCAQRAPIGVCKTDTVRIFDPATYQRANAWHIDYRKYHDLWVPDNQLDGIFVNRAS